MYLKELKSTPEAVWACLKPISRHLCHLRRAYVMCAFHQLLHKNQALPERDFNMGFSGFRSPCLGSQEFPRLPGLIFSSNFNCFNCSLCIAQVVSYTAYTPRTYTEPTLACMSKPISWPNCTWQRNGKGQGRSTLHKAPALNICDPVIQRNPLISLAWSQTNMTWPWHSTPTAARTIEKRLLQNLWERRDGQKRISLGRSRQVPTGANRCQL